MTSLGICLAVLLVVVVDDYTNYDFANIGCMLMLFYIVSRMTILVQVFLCFRALPESAYKEIKRTQFFPHLS